MGEVYPPWGWYMKQDALKRFIKQVKENKQKKFQEFKSNYLMDFFNIMV